MASFLDGLLGPGASRVILGDGFLHDWQHDRLRPPTAEELARECAEWGEIQAQRAIRARARDKARRLSFAQAVIEEQVPELEAELDEEG